MASERLSLFGSISPWSISRSSTPQPPANRNGVEKDEVLQRGLGDDHAVGNQYRLSLKQYPDDCPVSKVRWFYAVDAPKRKPAHFVDAARPGPAPKKFVPFSAQDSQSMENAFQGLLEREENRGRNASNTNASAEKEGITVPCQEDLLYDVDVEKRELGPAYWEGPIYEVRRGSWFYQEGATLRACDENLSTQLEQGFLKLKPWQNGQPMRSASQPRQRPESLSIPSVATPSTEGSNSNPDTPKVSAADTRTVETSDSLPNTLRLFGPYSNSTVTYQDSTTAWLASDDFMSRMSSTVYQRFGGLGGTKIIRGYTEPGKTETTEDPKAGAATPKDGTLGRNSSMAAKRKSAPSNTMLPPPKPSEGVKEGEGLIEAPKLIRKRTTLERQISSLAGVGDTPEPDELAEEARQQEEKEIEDSREKEGEDPAREVDHLILITHGIGQRLGLRLDSINFIHNVNTMRKTLKSVYTTAPDLQALNSQFDDMDKNSRIQVLPISWRHRLDFPGQAVRQNRREMDLGDNEDDLDYPSLQDITVDGIPAVRNLIGDLAMDVLLYQSAYREHIAGIVQRECNRIYKLFMKRNPKFKGRVSLCGHSLGSAIMFDILCRQKDKIPSKSQSRRSTGGNKAPNELHLEFDTEKFFCLGSPIALFQMLKGRKIAGREGQDTQPAESPFDTDTDPFSSYTPQAVSSPLCEELYNIFHPTDPIAYRLEPLISKSMAEMKAQQLPYTKKGLFGTAGISARMGQSVNSLWSSVTSGVASSLLNRSLGINVDDPTPTPTQPVPPPTTHQRGRSLGAAAPSTTSITTTTNSTQQPPNPPENDNKKQQALADQTLASTSTGSRHETDLPTLIDSEMETLYSGFTKTHNNTDTTSDDLRNPTTDHHDFQAEDQARKLRREEAKVKALNSNGRVDYSIQEGTFDISLLASIASHLSYWSDEDVNHFVISQVLSKGRRRPGSVE